MRSLEFDRRRSPFTLTKTPHRCRSNVIDVAVCIVYTPVSGGNKQLQVVFSPAPLAWPLPLTNRPIDLPVRDQP